MANATLQTFLERPFWESDLQHLVKIECQAGDASWNSEALVQYSSQLDRDIRVIAAADDEQTPIGFYAVEHGETSLYIANLAVAKDWRRKGVGTFALQSLEQMARDLNYAELVLDVQEENLAAQLLYRNAGLQAVEICRLHYGSQDGYRMTKQL